MGFVTATSQFVPSDRHQNVLWDHNICNRSTSDILDNKADHTDLIFLTGQDPVVPGIHQFQG